MRRRGGRGGRPVPIGLWIGGLLFLSVGLVALLGPLFFGDDAQTLTRLVRSGPSARHWLGTDELGRDNFSRAVTATRLTLEMGIGATGLGAVVGITAGSLIATAGARARAIGGRVIDLLMAYPPIVVAVVVTAILQPGISTAVYAIGAALIPQFARLSLRLASTVATRDYVVIGRHYGLGRVRVFTRHLVPNMAEPLLVLTSVALSAAIVALSALSFLGIGVQEPSYDWGRLLNDGLTNIYTNPSQVVGPLIGILLVGLASGLVGEGVAKRVDARVAESPERKPVQVTPLSAAAFNRTRDLVRLESLTVSATVPIVTGVDLSVGYAEVVGLCGESGSGKTTVANVVGGVLTRALSAEAAVFELNGVDVRGGRRTEVANQVGLIFQDPGAALNPAVRVERQVVEATRKHLGLNKSAAHELALQRLSEAGVPDAERVLRMYPHQLSGGLRQRVMIASALMLEPALLVADEPTTALDVTVQAGILDLLNRLRDEQRMSILIVSHDLAVLGEICDRVLVMHDGRFVEELSQSDLLARQCTEEYTQALFDATPYLPVDVLAGAAK